MMCYSSFNLRSGRQTARKSKCLAEDKIYSQEDKQEENPSAWLKTQNEIETQAGALIL